MICKRNEHKTCLITIYIFFYQGFLHGQGKRGDHLLFHSTTSTRSQTLRHLFATLHVRWLSRIFNTRLLLDEIYHLIELPFEWLIDDAMFVCLLDELILGFCYSDLTLETSRFELALTITLVLHVNRLTKCASHPKCASDVCNQVCWWCVYKTKLNPNILRYISTYILSCRIKKKKKKKRKKKNI